VSEFTVELGWWLGRAEDLRAHGAAAIPADVAHLVEGLRDLFRQLGGLALEAARAGDEVWTWQPAEDCRGSCRTGLALVRGNEIVGYWLLRDLSRPTRPPS
jgi:hypothetical protein